MTRRAGPIALPPPNEPVANGSGLGSGWYQFLARLRDALAGPLPLRIMTLAELPDDPPDGLACFCSDAAGGGVPVYSRGGLWRRYDTNNQVV